MEDGGEGEEESDGGGEGEGDGGRREGDLIILQWVTYQIDLERLTTQCLGCCGRHSSS
jgi:hypothetical protein